LEGLGDVGIGLSKGVAAGSSGTYEISELESELSLESAAVVGRNREAMMTLWSRNDDMVGALKAQRLRRFVSKRKRAVK
jgi:hypothetical protein